MLDVLLVVTVILLALVASAVALHWQNQQAVITQVARDFTRFETEFQDYLAKAGSPSDQPVADTEAPRKPTFRSTFDWSAPTPAGGIYRWEHIEAPAAEPPGGPALRAWANTFSCGGNS